MSHSPNPVYHAGQGFLEETPPPPVWRRIILSALLGLVCAAGLWGWLHEPAGRIPVQVTSQPEGARILLDLEDTGLQTPSTLDLPATGLHGLQVQLDGYIPRPLVHSLLCDTLVAGSVLDFRLEPAPRPVLQTGVPLPLPVAADTAASPKTVDPLYPARRPGPPGSATAGESPRAASAVIHFIGWDTRCRVRLDGREQRPDALGRLLLGTPGRHRVEVELGQGRLLDTTLVVGASGGDIPLRLAGGRDLVRITTAPVSGAILAGDRVLGQGEVLLSRSLLPQTLRFAEVEGYLEPASLALDKNSPADHRALYLAEQAWVYPRQREEGEIHLLQKGVWFEGQGFTAGEQGAPETREGRLWFGRARNDRRPWGCGQVVFEVDLPAGVHPGMPARLVLEALDTGENFPMSIKDHATLTVLFNGVALARDVELDRSLRARQWPVSRYLKPGPNRIELRGSEESTSWAALESLRLELGR